MSLKAKIKNFKVGPVVGYQFPPDVINHKCDGAYGIHCENLYEQAGFIVNKGSGPDLLQYDLEVKSKDQNSDAKWSMASVTVNNNSLPSILLDSIRKKMQRQVHITHNKISITDIQIHDFENDMFRNDLDAGILQGIADIINKNYDTSLTWPTVQAGNVGSFEKIKGTNQWKFRMTTKQMNYAKNSKHYNSIFTIG